MRKLENAYNQFFNKKSFILFLIATERQLAIIGEALNKFRKVEPDITIENDKQIIAFRNRPGGEPLIHAYDSIDNAIVWTILKRHLPNLKKEIENK